MITFILTSLSYCGAFIFGFFVSSLLQHAKEPLTERISADGMRKFEAENLEMDIQKLEKSGNTVALYYAKRLLETIKQDY